MYDQTAAKKTIDLDSILEAFERDDEISGGADVVAYLPKSDDPSYHRIAVELIRVDLERSWARGSRKRLEAYRTVTPELFDDPVRLAEIGFEEYRLRKQSGEMVTAAEYERRYAIDTSMWPSETDQDNDSTFGADSAFYSAPLVRSRRTLNFPAVGEKFADFELVEQLGRGAFGVVYRARQDVLGGRDVVLKITTARSVEPQRLARLQHTNVVPLYSMHEADGLMAICMPFFGRRTLGEAIRDNSEPAHAGSLSTIAERNDQTLPAADFDAPNPASDAKSVRPSAKAMDVSLAADLVAQLAEGLSHAHQRGIVHSDLKPANVLITDDGVPMLLDFNLSRDSAASQKNTLFVGGTLPYMSPEHLRAIRDNGLVTAQSDVYSLGVLAYEMLTGLRPFADQLGEFDDTVDVLIADRRRTPTSVCELNPQVSAGLASIVQHCLEFEPSTRYQSADQLADDLRRYQLDRPLRYASEPSIKERATKWVRRNSHAVRRIAAAALVAALVAVTAMYSIRHYRLASLEQEAAFNDFRTDGQLALLNLRAPGSERELHSLGRATAERAFEHLHLLRNGVIDTAALAHVQADHQQAARRQTVELLHALASLSVPPRGATVTPDMKDVKTALEYNEVAMQLSGDEHWMQTLSRQRFDLFTAAGDRDAAAQTADLVAKGKNDAQDTSLAMASLLQNRRFVEATATGELLCEEDRQDPQRWLLLGNAYVGSGHLASAEACYTALIALEPKATAGYLYRGLCRADEGNPSGAEKDFSDALLINPSLAVTRINRALSYLAERKYTEAEHDATLAMESGLADPRAYFIRALIRDALGKHDEAKADRDRGLTLEPVDDKGWVARGIALSREKPERAAHEFAKGFERYPTSKPLLQNLIHIYGDVLNQQDLALKYSGEFVALCPNDSAAYASRAVLFARMGDIDAALGDGAKAASAQPTALTSLQLACVYSLTSVKKPATTEQAILHLRKALAVDPKLAQRALADPDLAALQGDARFKGLIAAAQVLTNSAANANDPPQQDEQTKHGDTVTEKTRS
jgi:serine/threonine protein kinase/tetratricopeptide (TPR) repeat protein